MSNIQLAKNLSTLRKSYKLTQEEMSTTLNISRQAYSNYETNKRTPDLETLITLTQFYGITLDQLVNHSMCTEIQELTGPYTPGLNIVDGNTLYLTKEEVDLISAYRHLSSADRKILTGFCNNQITNTKKATTK